MLDDISERLRHIQQRTARLQQMTANLMGRAPERAEGMDSTGSVLVTIGPDNVPTAVEVSADWQRHLDPEQLGPAIMEASTAAVATRMQAWSQALEEDPVDSGGGSADEIPTPPAPNPLPAGAPGSRNLPDLIEEALRVFANLGKPETKAALGPVAGVGTDESGHVSVTLSPGGLQACEIDPRWARLQSGMALTAALAQALELARTNLTRNGETPASAYNGLLGEAFALLRNLQAGTDSREGHR